MMAKRVNVTVNNSLKLIFMQMDLGKGKLCGLQKRTPPVGPEQLTKMSVMTIRKNIFL